MKNKFLGLKNEKYFFVLYKLSLFPTYFILYI